MQHCSKSIHFGKIKEIVKENRKRKMIREIENHTWYTQNV